VAKKKIQLRKQKVATSGHSKTKKERKLEKQKTQLAKSAQETQVQPVTKPESKTVPPLTPEPAFDPNDVVARFLNKKNGA